MKKLFSGIILVIVAIITLNISCVNATSQVSTVNPNTSETQVENNNTQGELKELKEKSNKEIQDYTDKYGSEAYGVTAYILNQVRVYSIPLCFVGIAIGAIYQYVIGIRKMDVRDKGFGAVIAFVTLLIICQVLPLIFAIVVKGWRG